jgi:hypothetical protein
MAANDATVAAAKEPVLGDRVTFGGVGLFGWLSPHAIAGPAVPYDLASMHALNDPSADPVAVPDTGRINREMTLTSGPDFGR